MNLVTRREASYLRATAWGEFDIGDAERQFIDVVNSMIEHGTDRVLFDGELVTGDIDLMERYIYGDFAAMASAQLPDNVVPRPKFAYVLQDPVLDPFRVGERVARSLGMSVRAFDNKEEALAWLMSGER
jgi:hypothetical protein